MPPALKSTFKFRILTPNIRIFYLASCLIMKVHFFSIQTLAWKKCAGQKIWVVRKCWDFLTSCNIGNKWSQLDDYTSNRYLGKNTHTPLTFHTILKSEKIQFWEVAQNDVWSGTKVGVGGRKKNVKKMLILDFIYSQDWLKSWSVRSLNCFFFSSKANFFVEKWWDELTLLRGFSIFYLKQLLY